jgi:uncharacterized protein with von Willebrand factor type A (vWA) domain
MVCASIGTGGDPLERAFRQPTTAPRKLVAFCDVSGSMEPCSRALLLFVYALAVPDGARRRSRSRRGLRA